MLLIGEITVVVFYVFRCLYLNVPSQRYLVGDKPTAVWLNTHPRWDLDPLDDSHIDYILLYPY